MLRNGEILASLSRKRVVLLMLGIPVFRLECFKYGYWCPAWGSISYFKEIAFKSAKRSDMCRGMLQKVRYTDDHDLRFQCSKNLDMYSDYMNQFDLLMQEWKYSHTSIDVMHSDRFGNVQELLFETANSSDMGCATLLEGRFDDVPESSFQGPKFRIWAAKRSISYFSEIAFSGYKMFKYEQCHPARRSICWCSGIGFSCCETFKYE